jgi:DNA-binding PadR family transcriptional regulator
VSMSLNHPINETLELTPTQAIVLAFTIRQRCHWHEIADGIERGVCGSFLKLNREYVYIVLRRLEVLGYVIVVEGDAGQRRRITKRLWDERRWYRATPAGVRAYGRWIASKFNLESERAEILGRIASASAVRPGAGMLRAVLDECQAFCEGREEALAVLQALTVSCSGMDALCARLVFLERTITLRGLREWIRIARAHIAAYEQRHGSNGLIRRSDAWPARRNGSPGQVERAVDGEERVTLDVE